MRRAEEAREALSACHIKIKQIAAELFSITLWLMTSLTSQKQKQTNKTQQYFTKNPHVFTHLCWRFLEAKVPNSPPVTGVPGSPAWVPQHRAKQAETALKETQQCKSLEQQMLKELFLSHFPFIQGWLSPRSMRPSKAEVGWFLFLYVF